MAATKSRHRKATKCSTTHGFTCSVRGRGFCSNNFMTHVLTVVAVVVSVARLGECQDVFQPPHIIKPDRQETHYKAEQTSVEMKCHAEAKPRASYVWRKDGQPIDKSAYITFDSNSGVLTIPAFTLREEGNYTCIASNTVGSNVAASVSSPQRLVATRVDRFKPLPPPGDPTEVRAEQYGYAVLSCADHGVVVGSKEDITYNWYRKSEFNQISLDDNRRYIASDGSLHITYVEKKDRTIDESYFRCGISSNSLKMIRIGNPINLVVTDAKPKSLRPILRFNNSGVQVPLASKAKLECVFSGYDVDPSNNLPVITWYDDAGQKIPKDGVDPKYQTDFGGRVLVVQNVQAADDGYFQCQASNSAGNSRRHSLYLNVTSVPIMIKPLDSQTVTNGSDVTFRCQSKSLANEVPPGTPTWMLNGNLFDRTRKPNAVLSRDKKALTFTAVTKAKDILCVQCMVENSVGQTRGSGCLNVILPITVIVFCQKCVNQNPGDCSCTTWDISFGESVSVMFKESTDPAYKDKLNHKWTFKGIEYQWPDMPPFMTHDDESGEYQLKTSGLNQEEFSSVEGTYVFTVFHPYDNKSVDIHVLLDGGNPNPSVSSAAVDMWIIGLVIGIVFLIVVIVIIVSFILCRKLQEGAYNVDKKETNAGLDPVKELKDKGFTDLSRPEYYEEEKKKPEAELEYDDSPFGNDDESLGEYGVEEVSHFNENGSFIGDYSPALKPSAPPAHDRSTETTI